MLCEEEQEGEEDESEDHGGGYEKGVAEEVGLGRKSGRAGGNGRREERLKISIDCTQGDVGRIEMDCENLEHFEMDGQY